MQGHMRDGVITHEWLYQSPVDRMDLSDSALSSSTLFVFGLIGLGIHMSRVTQDALCSIYGKTTDLQITVYMAAIKHNQIKCSVVCRDC